MLGQNIIVPPPPPASVPLPAGVWLLLAALAGMALVRRSVACAPGHPAREGLAAA